MRSCCPEESTARAASNSCLPRGYRGYRGTSLIRNSAPLRPYTKGTVVASSSWCHPGTHLLYRGTSLIRKRTPLGPHRRPMPRVIWWSWEGGRFLMSEVPLY